MVVNKVRENLSDGWQEESVHGDESEDENEGDSESENDEVEGVWSSDGEDVDLDKKEKDQGKGQGRTKRECPLPYCRKLVVHIPRHLVQVHQWSSSQSRAALNRYNLRKKYTFKSKKSAEAGNRRRKQNGDQAPKAYKDYHKKRICPMTGCSACVKRLPAHLKKVHKIKPSSDGYQHLLKKALFSKGAVLPRRKRSRSEEEEAYEVAVSPNKERSASVDVERVRVEEEADKDAGMVENAESELEDDNSYTALFDQFAKWLQSPDGGKKDVKTVKQHAAQVNRILFVIDTDKNVESLLDFAVIKEKFVTYAEEKYVPETIKSYFTSLGHFYSFLLSENPKEIEVNCELVAQVRERVKRWSSSYKRSSLKHKWERQEEDRHELITPDQIEAFENSKISRDAIILLGKLSGAHNAEITQSQYTLLRNFLLVQISIDNANRAGVLANMTLKEFRRASKEDDRFVIGVMEHKTFHIHGPAQIVLTSNLHNWMNIFVEEVRAKVPGVGMEEHQPLFPSFNGTKLQSSQINKAIKSVWKQAGIAGRIHSTLLRKGAVTAVHKHQKEAASDLAELMAHKEDTAVKYYRLSEKKRASVIASKTLHAMMRNKSSTHPSKAPKELSETPEEEITDEQVGKDFQKCENNPQPRLNVRWSTEEIEEIRDLFKDEIKQKKVSMECVKEKIRDSEILDCVDSKRVYDRVRAEWRNPATEVEEAVSLPPEKENLTDRVNRLFSDDMPASSDIVPPTTLSHATKALFSEEQVRTLLRLCDDMVRNSPISRNEILNSLSDDIRGKEILATLSLSQVVNRIKYERRQRRAKN